MTEYIVTCDEETASWIGNDVESMRPIVRCRDCRHYEPDGEPSAVHPDCHWCEFMANYLQPDGFCKWSERRQS